MTALGKPDPARELAEVTAAIARLGEEHQDTTGKPALHVGRCSRIDLHERLVALYQRQKVLAQGIRAGTDPRRI